MIAAIEAEQVARGIAREEMQSAAAHRVLVDAPEGAVGLQPEGVPERYRVAPKRENGLVAVILPALDAELAVGIGNRRAAIGGDCERRGGDQRQETEKGSLRGALVNAPTAN